MSLSSTICEILVENGRLNLPHLYLAPLLGVVWLEFRQYFWYCLRDIEFIGFGTDKDCAAVVVSFAK